MRFLITLLAVLLSSLRVWGSPGARLSGRLSFDANSPSAEMVLGSGGEIKAESGIFMSMDEFGIGSMHLAVDSGSWGMFLGSGMVDGGFALRTKPYVKPGKLPVKLWTAKGGESAGSQIFGAVSGGLSFFMLCEPDSVMARESPADLSEIIEESFRFGGMEYVERFGEVSAGIAASMAERLRTVSGDGWGAGESFEQGSTHFVISSAARVKKQGILAGAWASGCGGYLESPGWAGSLDFEAKIAPQKAKLSASFNAFIFGSGPAYISPEGEIAPYDFLADAQTSIRIEPWSLALSGLAASLAEPGIRAGKKPLMKAKIPIFVLLPRLWKVDFLKSSLDLAFDVFALSSHLAADEYGLKNGSLSLRCADLLGEAPFWGASSAGSSNPLIGTAISARFARTGDGSADEESGMGSETQSMSGLDTLLFPDGLHLSSINFECSVDWEGSEDSIFRNGKVQLLLSSKTDEEKPVFVLSGSIVQKFRIGDVGEISISIKCPQGGYSLDAKPQAFPLLALECSFEGK